MAIKIYDQYTPEEVSVIWNGLPFEGFGDQFCTVAYDQDHVSQTQSPDGPVSRTIHVATTGTVSITLVQNSPTDRVLAGILATQKSTRKILNANMAIVDPSGTNIYNVEGACIQNAPDQVYGSSHEDGLRTWNFLAANIKIFGVA